MVSILYLAHNPEWHTVTTYYKSFTNSKFLYASVGTSIFLPLDCDYYIVGFGFHHYSKKLNVKFIKSILKHNIGIIYVCTKLPDNYIIHDNIIYVETGFRWFSHLLFKNPNVFKAVFSNDVERARFVAKMFATHWGFALPVITSPKQLPTFRKIKRDLRLTKRFLIETYDGLGDLLMSLPTAYTLHKNGWKVSYIVEKNRTCVFDNLDFIDKVFYLRQDTPIHQYHSFVTLSYRLSDYKQPYNRQHRIYSTAYLCGLNPKDLLVKKPIIVLSNSEINQAKLLLEGYKKTVVICWYAVGSNRTYPPELTQQLISLLSLEGYTPIVVGIQDYDFYNCINLQRKTSIRQLFAIINQADYVITVDTSALHIAGAFDKKTVALFGPIRPEWRCSTYRNCIPIRADVPCIDCDDRQNMAPDKCLCNKIKDACMKSIKPEKIVKVLKRL